ncbi:hypothetical protein M9Y10_009243 [Tritrichomonas musculus]|uniref:C2H2-type domain-containing protein n=1 Tax=Tritrichomonas musculus TaxID=1915356 RepID=A0ABR2IN09_9EUKA
MSKINQPNRKNSTSSKAFSLGNRGIESIFNELWNPDDSKVVFFFPDCNFPTYFFLTESPNLQKVLHDFSSSPIISIGFLSSNDLISFIILCCHQGVATINASINISHFLKSISSSTIISTNSDRNLENLNNFYRIKINAKEIDSIDDYINYIQSDKLGPNSKQILNHEVSGQKQSYTILDVLSICYRTVSAYHYFTTLCDKDKTAPLPMVHPLKSVQQNEQVKTMPLKLIPATSSTSPPSHSQINEVPKNNSNINKNNNNIQNASTNITSTQQKNTNKGTIYITSLIPNLNTNRPQSPPVLPKNLVPSQATVQSRAQSPPQALWQSQVPFPHSQSTSPMNSNISAMEMTKYFQQHKEKNAYEAQQQNIQQTNSTNSSQSKYQQRSKQSNNQIQQIQQSSSTPSPQKNQSKSPPAQFNPQQIVGGENRVKQRQQHVGSPPTQNLYPNYIRNGWHSLTSDPSFSDSTTTPGSGNSAPEASPELTEQTPIEQEIIAIVPNKLQQNNQQKTKQNQQKQQRQQRQQKQQQQQNQQQQTYQQKQQQNNKNDGNSTATDWKPIPKSKSPPNAPILLSPDLIQKQQAKSPPPDQRVKCPLCPLVFEKESLTLNHFVTQHRFLKEFDKQFRYTKDGLTCLVCHKTMKCYDFVIYHAVFFHYQLFESLILKIDDSESIKKFLQLFKNKIPVISNHRKRDAPDIENQVQDTRSLRNAAVQTDTPEDLFDDSYCNFIASSINTKGIATEKIELSKIEPIEIEMIQENLELFEVPVDAHFWKQLDMLEALMKGTDKATFDDDHFFCKICNVKCKSNATLLQHCFEQHRDLLDSFD